MTVHIERSLSIDADSRAVWAVIADFASISRWAPKVEHSAAASTIRDGLGAVRRVQVGRVALMESVTEWEPEQRLTYLVAGLPPAAGTVTTTWQIEPRDTASLTSVTTLIEPGPGPAGKVVSRVVSRLLARAADQMLRGLAEHLRDNQEQL